MTIKGFKMAIHHLQPKPILISPPFGRWVTSSKCTSIKGSYTLEKRPGLIWQIIKTLRFTKDGWVNAIGLRNPGIKSIHTFSQKYIYSLVGFSEEEWQEIYDYLPKNIMVEINLGCPNTDHDCRMPPELMKKFVEKFAFLSLKLPPVESLAKECFKLYCDTGVSVFHFSNTLPTKKGGLSGAKIKPISINLMKWARGENPNIDIIAGGGIRSHKDIDDYKKAGATYFSISSLFFNPIKAYKLLKKL